MLSRLKFEIEGLFQEIYDERLPETLFMSETTTFADLQSAGLQSIIPLVNKLRKYGHSDENIRSRVFAFMENDLYLNYVQVKNSDLPVTFDIYKESIDMKFDVIVGNPPYQDPTKTQGKNSSLWTKFILKSNELIKENGFISLVTPLSWIAPTETQKNELKDVFYKNNLIYVNTECEKYFNVGSTFSYFIIQKSDNYVGTTVNEDFIGNIKLKILPNVLNSNTISITKKIFCNDMPKLKFSSGLRNDNLNDDGEYMVWYGDKLKRSNVLGGNYNKLKVIVNKPGYLKPKFDNGVYNTSANNYWVEVSNETEANNIISFFNTQIGKIFFDKFYKYSGYNSLGVLKSIPEIVKNENWSDEKIIRIFSLTPNEVNEIF